MWLSNRSGDLFPHFADPGPADPGPAGPFCRKPSPAGVGQPGFTPITITVNPAWSSLARERRVSAGVVA